MLLHDHRPVVILEVLFAFLASLTIAALRFLLSLLLD
jgi:hypothetical protein